jgi:ATP-dependent protease ClpP protease subunit
MDKKEIRYGIVGIGKQHELVAVRKEQDLTQTRLLNHIAKCTGLSHKKINKELMPPHDVFLSGEEAREYNICDIVKTLE